MKTKFLVVIEFNFNLEMIKILGYYPVNESLALTFVLPKQKQPIKNQSDEISSGRSYRFGRLRNPRSA